MHWTFEFDTKGSLGRALTFGISTEDLDQASFSLYSLRIVSVDPENALGHLRYRFTDVPPQPNFQTEFCSAWMLARKRASCSN